MTNEEAEFVRHWIDRNAAVEKVWPCTELARRVQAVFADGRITEEECAELREIMDEITVRRIVASTRKRKGPI